MSLHTITTAHSYRAILIPADIHPEEVEQLADDNLLPVLQLKAASASHATISAGAASGLPVLRVERMEA